MEKQKLYSETLNTFRHYSTLSSNMTLMVVVQGILLLTATGYLFKNGEYFYSLMTSLFGSAFTILIGLVHRNYQVKANIHARTSRELEEECGVSVKPMASHQKSHEALEHTPRGYIFYVTGVHYLMILAFTSTAMMSLYLIWSKLIV